MNASVPPSAPSSTQQQEASNGPEAPPVLDTTRLPALVQEWLSYTSAFPTTQTFNLWACLAAIGGALQRRCWIVTAGRALFPNTFILLISPPGIGKSDAIGTVRQVWSQFANLPVAPISMTGKGMIDELASDRSHQSFTLGGQEYTFSSLLVPAPELGTLLQEYDTGQISILNDLYDCGSSYNERTRGGGELYIENPHISMLLGTQPKFLGHVFPEHAFGMGLTSRMLMVYDDKQVGLDLFGSNNQASEQTFQSLVNSFKPIARMKGQFDVSPEAQAAIQELYNTNIPPQPTTFKLEYYNTRRTSHLLKLCMMIGAARHSLPYIALEDVENSYAVLLDVEKRMGEIFVEMANVSEAEVIREAFQHLVREYNNNDRKPLRESVLNGFLQQRVASWKVDHVINNMRRSGNIIVQGNKNARDGSTLITPGKL